MFAIAEIFGIVGLILLLIGFLLNHFKKFKRFTYTYNGLNLIGAALLTVYAYVLGSFIFVVLEFIWTVAAAYFILKKIISRGSNIHGWDEIYPQKDLTSVAKKKPKKRIVRKKKEEDSGEGGTLPWFQ